MVLIARINSLLRSVTICQSTITVNPFSYIYVALNVDVSEFAITDTTHIMPVTIHTAFYCKAFLQCSV